MEGAKALGEVIANTKTLRKLDISHNSFCDKNVHLLTDALRANKTITTLNASHNAFGENSGVRL